MNLERNFVSNRPASHHRCPVVLFLVVLQLILLLVIHPSRAVAGEFGDPRCSVQGLVEGIEPEGLERIVRELSGADAIDIGGKSIKLKTRYTLSGQKYLALRYLIEEIERAGYEPLIQSFIMNYYWPDLDGIAVSPDLDTVWVGDMGGKVYRALGADRWEAYSYCGELTGEIYDLEIGPYGKLWAACGLKGGGMGGLFCSTDGGSSWRELKSGAMVYSLKTVTLEDESFGVAAGAYGTVLRTEDGGKTWLQVLPQFTFWGLNGSATNGPMHFWVVGDHGSIYESTDAGMVWSERFVTTSRLFGIDFCDSLMGVVVGDHAAFLTEDGGSSWSEVPIDAVLMSVEIVDSLIIVAGGMNGEVWLSDDGGVAWTCLDDSLKGDASYRCITSAGRDRIWFAGENEVGRIDLDGSVPSQYWLYEIEDTLWGENILFHLEGRSEPDRRIVLSAHYDSQPQRPYEDAPGADDNASGVAGVLESARALMGAWVERTIEFILFDGEEQGCLGSEYFVDHLDNNASYEAVVNLDMLGYDGNGDRGIEIAGREDPLDSSLVAFIMETIDTLDLELVPEFLTSQSPISDHRSFWRLDTIPSVLFIEKGYQDNPYYHTAADTADNLDYLYLAEGTKAALASVVLLAGYSPPASTGGFVLKQNWPNPFRYDTRITFSLPAPCFVELAVYDVTGRRVALLKHADVESGELDPPILWDGTNDSGKMLASGVYFLRLKAGESEWVRKVVILR